MIDYAAIGRNIDTIRIERGWTKTALAEKMGKQNPTVFNHIKNGRMSLEALAQYAETLGCDIADLLVGVSNPEDFHLEQDLFSYYPYNLARAVVCPNFNPNNPEMVEQAKQAAYGVYVPALLEAVDALDGRESRVIRMRYDNHLTLEQAGSVLGVTRERIRQIEARALRRLRHPACWRKWRLDTMRETESLKKENQALTSEICRIRQTLDGIVSAMGVSQAQSESILSAKEEPKKITVEEMGLSVRSYNVLKRHSINTLDELAELSVSEMQTFRNLGRKSMMEIIEKAREYGVNIPVNR